MLITEEKHTPDAAPAEETSRSLRVLVVTGDDPSRFRALGSSREEGPRHELAYPYYEALAAGGDTVDIAPLRYQDLRAVWRSARRLHDVDVAVGWSMEGALLALAARAYRLNRRVAVVVYANRPPRSNAIARRGRNILFVAGLRAAGAVIYVTREQAEAAPRDLGIDPERAADFQTGTDTSFWRPAQPGDESFVSADLRRATSQPYVVVSGDQQRDEESVFAALEGIGAGLVRLTQEPGTQAFWEQRAGQTSFPVFCKASLPFIDVRYVYQRALCVLNLVDNSWQPAGLTVAKEAMACGTPLVMSEGLTTREILRHATPGDPDPFIVAPNTDAARDAVLTLKSDAGMASKLRGAGRSFVERHLELTRRAPGLREILSRVSAQARKRREGAR